MEENLKMLLVLKHKKPSELADYLNVSRSCISKWLGGVHIPDKYHQSICDFLGITLNDLMKEQAKDLKTVYDIINSMSKQDRISLIEQILETLR